MSEQPDRQNAEEEKKRLYLKVGVWIFSVLLISVWALNLRYSFSGDNTEADGEISAWREEFSETVDTIKSGIAAIDKEEDPLLTASSTEKTNEENAFLDGLIDGIEKPATDAVASGTATITPEKMIDELERRVLPPTTVATSTISCPEYINCMPTIGESRPCVIPPGCENTTQIAY